MLEEIAAPEFVLFGPQGQRSRGRDTLVRMMDSDLDAGVQQRLLHVTAGRRVTILECDLLNPISDPQHCPPGVLWLMTLQDEKIDRIKLFHPIALPRSKALGGS